MTDEEIEKFRLGCEKELKEMSEEEFNRIYNQWEAFDHTFTKVEKTIIIAKLLEDFIESQKDLGFYKFLIRNKIFENLKNF